MSKSLVFIDDFSKEEIYQIFKLADKFAGKSTMVKMLAEKNNGIVSECKKINLVLR